MLVADVTPTHVGQLSPDGQWRWDGAAWRPVSAPLPAWASTKLRSTATWAAVAFVLAIGLLADQALRTGTFGLAASLTFLLVALAAGESLAAVAGRHRRRPAARGRGLAGGARFDLRPGRERRGRALVPRRYPAVRGRRFCRPPDPPIARSRQLCRSLCPRHLDRLAHRRPVGRAPGVRRPCLCIFLQPEHRPRALSARRLLHHGRLVRRGGTAAPGRV